MFPLYTVAIVTTVLFLIIVLVTFVTGNMGVAICFMPFVFLGIALILAYKKQIIVVNEDEIVFSYLVKKTQHIKYNDIRCILMIPLNGCLLYTSPSPRDYAASRMPSSA